MALADAVPFAVAHFSLDEASGSRVSSVGSHTLTDNNTVASAAFKFSNGADFESSNSEWLSEANSTEFDPGNNKFMARAWVRLESKAASMGVVGKSDVDGDGRSWLLYYNVGIDRFVFLFQLPSGVIQVFADNFGSPSTGVDYLLHGWHDPNADLIGISVNAGTANTLTTGGEANQTRTCDFRIGRYDNGNYFDGLIDDVVVLKGYFLDATERPADYNSGTGVRFADWAPRKSRPPIMHRPLRFFGPKR